MAAYLGVKVAAVSTAESEIFVPGGYPTAEVAAQRFLSIRIFDLGALTGLANTTH